MKKAFVLLFLLLLLQGCARDDHNNLMFSGESEHWTGELEVFRIGDKAEKRFTLRYKSNEQLTVPIDFSYSYSGGNYSAKGQNIENNKIVARSVSSNVPLQKSEEIPIHVEWDGKKEDVMLKSK
ncbi:hypothetical protein SAMN04487970_101588 [Paenibacillus tianmuensis]|uniref:Lipoprotein n=1 Tax=Paenibacillus tianmuensis TaxID=624147 RepID=A0A1G4RGM1_9BACL|nr:hypothetical protein [Paenibacillus tianmuensis]SCW56112.1 hypothetical protein SAMN04487970_101588 [Paenibacillus tianmuensis]